MQIGEQALEALIWVASTQSIRAGKSKRYRALKRVAFCEQRLEFMRVVRFTSAAQTGPAGLDFCAADFLGQVLIKRPW